MQALCKMTIVSLAKSPSPANMPQLFFGLTARNLVYIFYWATSFQLGAAVIYLDKKRNMPE